MHRARHEVGEGAFGLDLNWQDYAFDRRALRLPEDLR